MSTQQQELVQEFQFRNPVKQLGFAQIDHAMSMDPELSDGARCTFLLYLKYAHQNPTCWPSIARIASDRRKSEGTISRHNRELVKLGYITRNRRMSLTTLTIIEDVEQIPRLQELATAELQLRRDVKNDRTVPVINDSTVLSKTTGKTCQKRHVKEESLKDNQGKNKEGAAPTTQPQLIKTTSRVSAGSKKQKDVSPAAAVLQSLTGYYPPRSWKQDVENIMDLDRWEAVIKAWVGLGRNPMNVSAMLEHYNENRIPTVKGAQHESSSGVKPQAATPEVVAAFRAHQAEQRRAAELEGIRTGAGP